MAGLRKPWRLSVAQKLCRTLPPIFAQRFRNLIYPIERAYRDDYNFVVRAQTGSMFTNRTSDFHAYPFSVHGYYEWRNWAIAAALCSPGDTIFEVGANIGTETVGFADMVGQSGKVYAFEPFPSNVIALEETLRLNRQRNVIVLPCAVGEESKRIKFVLPPKHASGLGHILMIGEKADSTGIEVDCITLDSLADRTVPVKMIFTDAEGAEVAILRGAKKYISRDKPSIVLEAHPGLLARAGFCLQDLYNEITSLGYEAFKISRLGLTRVNLRYFPAGHNWLCVHSSKIDAINIVQKYIRMCGLLPCIPGLNPITRRPVE